MMADQPARGVDKYLDREVYTADGKKLGTSAKLLRNRVTEMAEWLVVEAGLLGREKYVVPLAGSELGDDRVNIAYDGDMIGSHPHADSDSDNGTLSLEDEDALNHYYGLGANK